MPTLPIWTMTVLSEFTPVIYGQSTWYKVEVLVVGAILATGKRTASAVLRVMSLSADRHYAQYHHVLSRAMWSGLEASAVLLRLLLKAFGRGGPLVFGLDETIERRRGDKIKGKFDQFIAAARFSAIITFPKMILRTRQRCYTMLGP